MTTSTEGFAPAFETSHCLATAKIYLGDCRDTLRQLPAESVHCVVTSPPYFGLRDYGHEGQLGLEKTHSEYVVAMVEVFNEVWRVLRSDGVCWLNLGDTYAHDAKWGGYTGGKHVTELHGSGASRTRRFTGLKRKELIGIPWRVAFALQDAGWFLRSEIVWEKPNAMPESVRDRCTRNHETLFMLTKRYQYFFDQVAIAEPATKGHAGSQFHTGKTATHQLGRASTHDREDLETRNKRTVWSIPTQPTKEAHFATFPEELVETCILAGTSAQGCCPQCGSPAVRIVHRERVPTRPGVATKATGNRKAEGNRDPQRHITLVGTKGWELSCKCLAEEPVPCTVLDPFSGSGTTGMVALKHGRNYIGCELNPEYLAISRQRIERATGDPTLFDTVFEDANDEPIGEPLRLPVVQRLRDHRDCSPN